MTRRPLPPSPPKEHSIKPPASVDSPLVPGPWPDDPNQSDSRSPVEQANDDFPLDPETPAQAVD